MIKTIGLGLIGLLSLAAQPPRIPRNVEAIRNVPYCTGGGHPLLMDIFRPKDIAAKYGIGPERMIHGGSDRLVPFDQPVRMLNAYQKAGLNARLVKVGGAGHGFKPSTGKPDSLSNDEINSITVEFFRKYLTN